LNRILITGGAGFIGTHLAERLAPNAEIILFDNFRRDSLRAAPWLRDDPRVRLITGDVLDAAAVESACRGVDTVVHLAAIAGVNSYYQESLRTLQVNILGTVNLLEAATRTGVKHFVDFSTSEVFGSDAMWVTEESPHGIGPVSDRRWVYATSKLATEHFTLRFGEQHGFAATCVRPFNIYGPRQTGEGAIGNFCRAGLTGRPLTVYGDGTPIRAWCYVSDMVDAVESILRAPERAAGHTFNIGNPREVETTLGLARRVARLIPGSTLESKQIDRAEVRARVPSIEKARSMLGYEPKVDLEEGLTRTIDWFRKDMLQSEAKAQ
jgi:nucleoside-diphosphate-sugar epimerase